MAVAGVAVVVDDVRGACASVGGRRRLQSSATVTDGV